LYCTRQYGNSVASGVKLPNYPSLDKKDLYYILFRGGIIIIKELIHSLQNIFFIDCLFIYNNSGNIINIIKLSDIVYCTYPHF